jgi:uncharacterized membrane protein YfhO
VITTRITIIVALLLYVLLWIIALNGASGLIPILAIPVVLAVLVAAGVGLNRYMGITPRKQHFNDRDKDSE